jgi:hypothetical protein
MWFSRRNRRNASGPPLSGAGGLRGGTSGAEARLGGKLAVRVGTRES